MSLTEFAQGIKTLARDHQPALTCSFGELANYDPTTHAGKFLLPLHRDSTDNPIVTGYVPLATAFTGAGFGEQFEPVAGAQAIIIFMDSEIPFPVVAILLYNSVEKPPFTDGKSRGWLDAKGNAVKTTDDGVTGGDGLGGAHLVGGGYGDITAPQIRLNGSTKVGVISPLTELGAQGLAAGQGVVTKTDLQAVVHALVVNIQAAFTSLAGECAAGTGVGPPTLTEPTAGGSTTVKATD